MSKKSIMVKLLTMLTFFGGIKTKAFVYFPKYLGQNMSVNQLLDENQNIDEKNIIKKCIEINSELIKLVDRFTDYQNTVKKIINQIRIWFDEIQKSKRFEEISKTKEFKEKMDKYDEDEFFGEKVTRDFIYDCYTLLPEDERKEFDKKAEEFRNKLLDILKNEEKKFHGCGEHFTELTSNFDSLIKTLKYKEYDEKGAKDILNKLNQAGEKAKSNYIKNLSEGAAAPTQDELDKIAANAITKAYEALSQEDKNLLEKYMRKMFGENIGVNVNVNLMEKKKILSFMLDKQKVMISRLKNNKIKWEHEPTELNKVYYAKYGYDFKNPTLLIDEFKEFLKNVNLHKQYVEINDLKYSFPLNINDLMRGQNKISELKIQVYIFNQRQKLMNDDKNYINDTNKDFEFLLQNL